MPLANGLLGITQHAPNRSDKRPTRETALRARRARARHTSQPARSRADFCK